MKLHPKQAINSRLFTQKKKRSENSEYKDQGVASALRRQTHFGENN